MIDDSKLYSVNYPNIVGTFTYMIKHIGAEVRGHGKKAAK